MVNEGYYIGSDLKFQIDITATGFNQHEDNYDIDIYCGDSVLHYNQDDVISHDGSFYLPVPTANLQPGMLRMVVTAYVPDEDFDDGTRKEIAVRNLKYLKNVM